MFVIPVLGRLRQEDHEFKGSLGYIERHCLKKTKQTNKKETDRERERNMRMNTGAK
jgi:hypothetical protein